MMLRSSRKAERATPRRTTPASKPAACRAKSAHSRPAAPAASRMGSTARPHCACTTPAAPRTSRPRPRRQSCAWPSRLCPPEFDRLDTVLIVSPPSPPLLSLHYASHAGSSRAEGAPSGAQKSLRQERKYVPVQCRRTALPRAQAAPARWWREGAFGRVRGDIWPWSDAVCRTIVDMKRTVVSDALTIACVMTGVANLYG